jgi:quercetin dioxygenase-like cupin family protein
MTYVANDEDHQQLAWLGGSVLSLLLEGGHTSGQLMAMSSTLARGDAAPVHLHTREDEVFVLLEGSAIIWAGEQRYEVVAGGVAFLPRDVPHTYRITSDGAKMLTLCIPAGLEGFFRDAGHDLAQPRPAGWAVDMATMGKAAAAHGVSILGPPRTD